MPKAGNRSANAEKLTNRQVITYYARFNEKCPKTENYLKELQKSKTLEAHLGTGDYIDLAYSFMFFRWLYGCDEEFNPKLPDWLINIAPHLIVPDKTNFYDLEFQKWHLIVSWYAYSQFQIDKEIGNKREKLKGKELLDSDAQGPCGILEGSVTCSELLLWMYEAAGGKDTCEKIKNLKCIQEETDWKIRRRRKLAWAQGIKDKIASLLKEQCGACKSSDFCEVLQ